MSTKASRISPTADLLAVRWKPLGLTSRRGDNLHDGADQGGPIDGRDAAGNGAAVTIDVDSAPLCGGLSVVNEQTGAGLLGPQIAAFKAADRKTMPAAEPMDSSTIVGHKTTPPMSLTAEVTGSSTPPSSFSVGQTASPCCGSCGYVNCPLQPLAQAPGNAPLNGQLYSSKSPGAADTVNSRSGVLGASISDPMSSQIVAPVTGWNGQLPGGGETGVGTTTGQIGVLSGSVTTAVAPQL